MIRIKEVCYKCNTFNENQRSKYKCACQSSCPGLNWSNKKKETYIRNRQTKR